MSKNLEAGAKMGKKKWNKTFDFGHFWLPLVIIAFGDFRPLLAIFVYLWPFLAIL